MNMNAAIENLITAIFADYTEWQGDLDKLDEKARVIREKMLVEFREKLSFKEGKKYIKVIKDGSVWGFVVNTTDDPKFRYGDILKAVSWSSPARNSARGNVFEDYDVTWTGPHYAR
jgi:hypothetical protein